MASKLASMVLGRQASSGGARMKRAERGLFHGKMTRAGNNRSHSLRASRRIWKPNAQWVRLWSDALETKLRLKVTTKALKVIDKRGGLDKYLLETRPVMLGRGKPQALRELVKKTMAERVARGEPATWLEALKAERGSGVAASGSADDLEDGPGIVDVDMPEAADAVPEERA